MYDDWASNSASAAELDPVRVRHVGTALEVLLGQAVCAQCVGAQAETGEGIGVAQVSERRVQRVAPGSRRPLHHVGAGSGLAVVLPLARHEHEVVPDTEGRPAVPGEAGERHGLVEMPAGALRCAGIDGGEGSGRQRLGSQAVQPVPHPAGGSAGGQGGLDAPGEFGGETLHGAGTADRAVQPENSHVVPVKPVDDIRLCVSGLAINALLHGTPRGHGFRMHVAVDDGVVRIEVHDASDARPRLLTPAETDDHGRGLQLVDALADDWDISGRLGIGKVVWAVFKTPSGI
ncbi:ATP-binding protein [Streptomyces sp. CNQ-509]|uniref:ATP-binding protein n=1 Tax=Streptomyces sp. CNQ-509 TaxID=444103 RepID=UPI0020A69F43|nr:ATP-binding protein [Streptomyces sp. CNQ-509]